MASHEPSPKRPNLANKNDQEQPNSKPKTTRSNMSKFLSSIASDDMLHEIFTRLRSPRTALRCAAVCHRWSSVVSQPRFLPSFKRQGLKKRRQNITTSHYDIASFSLKLSPNGNGLAPDTYIGAAFEDLILVHVCHSKKIFLFHPLTRQQVDLPDPPVAKMDGFALVFDQKSENYAVLIINRYPLHADQIKVLIFRSETGVWDVEVRTVTIQDRLHPCIRGHGTGDGTVYVPTFGRCPLSMGLKRITALNPFDATGFSERWVALPSGFKRGWRGSPKTTNVGVVRGELRLWQGYYDKMLGGFVFSLWVKRGDDGWVWLHGVKLEIGGEGTGLGTESSVIALHPEDDGVFFFKNSGKADVWRYTISSRNSRKIGQMTTIFGSDVMLVATRQPWPTTIPTRPST